ncbi:MAG: hypothetical protein U9R11_04175 [Chloroflexota bacterium]|nr:hypothetical protein [Chloroflexota bacterium]
MALERCLQLSTMEMPPTTADWQALYQAAMEFKEIEAWTWMYDSDVFGVQNPASGEIGYCCIMGALGEVFALALYLGTEGLESYMRIASESPWDPSKAIETALLQKCLMASFGSREELTREDRQVIKRLGLKFRGRTALPLFRSYRPAYHPWYLTADEARFLTLALQQARQVCLRFQEDPALFDPPQEGLWFVRVPEETKKGLSWRDAWLEPSPLEEELPAVTIDELRLARLKKATPLAQAIWEMDFFLSPTAVQEKKGQRPYYPYLTMSLDHGSGLVLGTDLASPGTHLAKFPERFLSLAERLKRLPAEIWVKKEKAYKLLEPITSHLGINLYLVDELEALEEARAAMWEFMGGPGRP